MLLSLFLFVVVAAVVDVVAVEIEAEPEVQSDTHDGMDAEASPPHPTSSYHPGGGLIGSLGTMVTNLQERITEFIPQVSKPQVPELPTERLEARY